MIEVFPLFRHGAMTKTLNRHPRLWSGVPPTDSAAAHTANGTNSRRHEARFQVARGGSDRLGRPERKMPSQSLPVGSNWAL